MNIVLQIGDQIITAEKILPLLAQYQMLPQLAREIIIDQAIANIECTPEEQTIARQKFYQQHQITTEAQIQAWVEQRGMTLEQLEKLTQRGLKLEKFKQATWGNQLEAYFLKRKRQLDRIVYSLIRTQDAGIAQELYFRIQEQETSFAELAKQYSQGSEAQTGGLIGPVELSTPHPKIAQMLTSSQPGQLLPPTRVGDWLVIVRLEKFIGVQLDEPMRQRLLDELFRSWLSEQLQQKVSFFSKEGTTSSTFS
ncbi:MAG: peptidylprolyl isomerase [Xenococcaceae cyanobacterium]